MKGGVFFLAIILGILTPLHASAHALGVECNLRHGRVRLEAFFDDDTPARAAKVRVVDGAQKEIAAGQTDAKGKWSFPQPAAGKYQVIIEAGQGHRATAAFVVPGAAPVERDRSAPPISEGPTRAEFTRFPWLKIGLGVGLILLLAVAFVVARRSSASGGR